ncbi:MAG: polyprenyl synthetase family protein [Flammeovirgaceae bacterium]|nr:polyprenyl synthetase family protein [Flammeovirgaceae bacterium]
MSFDVTQVQKLINQQLAQLELSNQPPELYQPIRYMFSIGGKRMRPILTLLGCYLFSEDYKTALEPALAVEVFHNFTLLHDDIMDDAPLRRGKPTVYSKWNSNIAILSGDIMFVKAYDLLIRMKPELAYKVIPLFNQCAKEVCEGQQFDMNFENIDRISIEEYINMIRLKTAVLLGLSLEIGALTGGATNEEASLLNNFGVNIGIGFQLKDDLLDVYGDKEKFGKKVGGDIIANKKTFLLINALEKSEREDLEKLQSWTTKKDFDPEKKVEEITNIYNKYHIREETEKAINQYFGKAFDSLENLKIKAEKKKYLIGFTKDLIDREQ